MVLLNRVDITSPIMCLDGINCQLTTNFVIPLLVASTNIGFGNSLICFQHHNQDYYDIFYFTVLYDGDPVKYIKVITTQSMKDIL